MRNEATKAYLTYFLRPTTTTDIPIVNFIRNPKILIFTSVILAPPSERHSTVSVLSAVDFEFECKRCLHTTLSFCQCERNTDTI